MLFIEFPGARERQLQRKYNHSALFSIDKDTITTETVLMVRQDDAAEVEDFMNSFRSVVERAVSLKPNEQSDVILALKEDLDKHYEHCSSLQGDMSKIKQALVTLIQAIMGAVRTGAGNDVNAQSKLDEEDQARAEHYRLQEYHFIADLMREEASIPADELGVTLLTEPMNVISEALELFQPEQLGDIIKAVHTRLSSLDDDTIIQYQDKVNAISAALMQTVDQTSKN